MSGDCFIAAPASSQNSLERVVERPSEYLLAPTFFSSLTIVEKVGLFNMSRFQQASTIGIRSFVIEFFGTGGRLSSSDDEVSPNIVLSEL